MQYPVKRQTSSSSVSMLKEKVHLGARVVPPPKSARGIYLQRQGKALDLDQTAGGSILRGASLWPRGQPLGCLNYLCLRTEVELAEQPRPLVPHVISSTAD
jgi:hypothetical protein